MAFKNILFPTLRLIHGIGRSRGDSTIVMGNGYKEFRLKRSSVDPQVWSFPARDLMVEDARALIAFYNEVEGGFYSFRFRDPDDNEWNVFTIKHFKDDKWKVTSNSGSPIFQSGIISAFRNGISVGGFNIQLDDDHPYIQVPGSTSSDVIQISGSFTYTARFNGTLTYSINALDVNNKTLAAGISDFELKEVAEHA